MLGTKTSETFSQNNKTDLELLDPLYEVNESLGNEEASEKELSEDAFPEISPRIFGLFNIKDPLTCEGLNNAIYELGVINLCWPDIQDPVFETRTCFPKSYYTNNGKERLLLAYAENFRRQFIFKRTTHKALLLQAPNECGLQKMVCTTIRPTKLCYRGMNTWEGCASLVADFFNYEPLLKPMLLVDTSEEAPKYSTPKNSTRLKRPAPKEEEIEEESVEYIDFDQTSPAIDHQEQDMQTHSRHNIDEYEAIGINVAAKLRRMKPAQAIYAEMLINKTITCGLLNKLSCNTDLSDEPS